jgi:hypothetical protein
MKLKIYVEDPTTGEMTPDTKPELTVTGRNLDKCMEAARALLKERDYPPIRSLNAGENDTLVIYCAQVPQRAEATSETDGLKFQVPSRYQAKLK